MNARVHPEATAASLSEGADYELLAQRFRPIFARIAEGAVERERQRELPHEAIVAWQAGRLRRRAPCAARARRRRRPLPQLVQLLIELAEADSNITQAPRPLRRGPSQCRARPWPRPLAAAPSRATWSAAPGPRSVRYGWAKCSPASRASDDGRWVVNGSKYYSTGSLFSDWIDLYAQRDDTGADVIAAIRTDQPGVRQSDDWDGFGQRTTGSGTSLFEDAAEVEEENLIDFASRFKYQTAFYQLVLLAVLAGTGRAALRDVAAEVRGRTRIYSHGNAPRVSQDPQVQRVVGRIAARVYAAEAATLRAAEAAQRAYLALRRRPAGGEGGQYRRRDRIGQGPGDRRRTGVAGHQRAARRQRRFRRRPRQAARPPLAQCAHRRLAQSPDLQATDRRRLGDQRQRAALRLAEIGSGPPRRPAEPRPSHRKELP